MSLGLVGWGWASDGFCGLSAVGVVCCVGALCLFFLRCRPFVGVVSRFNAESRVVVAHLRVSLHYCVSLAWGAGFGGRGGAGLRVFSVGCRRLEWCAVLARCACSSHAAACLWVQICALMQFHALLQRIYA